MDIALSILTGIAVAGASYLMMSGSLIRFLLGLVIISNAVNLIIFVSGRLTFAGAPFIDKAVAVWGRCGQPCTPSTGSNRDRDRPRIIRIYAGAGPASLF